MNDNAEMLVARPPSSSVIPHLDVARAFIAGLTGSPDTEVLWQLVPDSFSAPVSRNATHLWALTEKAWNWLSEENTRCSMGVFIQVNEGNSERRRTENVVAVRALFIDDDKGLLPPDSPRLAALPPTLSVRTRKGWHHYWVLVPGEALSAFTSAQASLAAHFGTDPAVKDLPRVMRVPGFLHQKDPSNPVLVQLVRVGSERYRIADVLGAFGVSAGIDRLNACAKSGAKKSFRRVGAHRAAVSTREGRTLLQAILHHPLVGYQLEHPEDVSYVCWRGTATNIAAACDGRPELLELGRRLFHAISSADPRRYSETGTDRMWESAVQSAASHGPMLLRTMEEAGAPAELCRGPASTLVGAARLLLQRGD